jgi:hypothetical protein
MFARGFAVLAVVTLALGVAPRPLAQPLAEQVPADALVYLGWAGSDAMGEDYAQSHLHAVLEATGLRQELVDFVDRQLAREGQRDEDAQIMRQIVNDLSDVAWERPWALYFDGLWMDHRDDPLPRIGFLIEPTDEQRETVQHWLSFIADALAEEEVPAQRIDRDGVLGLVIGTPRANAPAALAGEDRFTESLSIGVDSPAIVIWGDAPGLLGVIDEAIAAEANDAEDWQAFRDAAGLDGLDVLVWTGGFADQDWRTDLLIGTRGEREGLLALLDQNTLEPMEALRAIPASAVWARAAVVDVEGAVEQVLDMLESMDPDIPEDFEQFLAEGERETGVHMVDDLIRPLGERWLLYNDPQFEQQFSLGMVLLNPTDDDEDAGILRTAIATLSELAETELQGSGAPMGMSSNERDGTTVYTLTTPVASPSWAVDGDVLMLGISPNALRLASEWMEQPEADSLGASEAWTTLWDRLDVDAEPNGIMYADLERSAPMVWQTYQMGLALIAGEFNRETGENLFELLPDLSEVTPHLGPAANASWTDDAGYHVRTISPFPGSLLYSQEGAFGLVTSGSPLFVPLTVGWMVPAAVTTRGAAMEMQAASNIRQISFAMIRHAQRQREPGKPAPMTSDLSELLSGQTLRPEHLVAPDREVPAAPLDNPQQLRQWVQQHSSYVIVPGLTDAMDTRQVAIFGKPSHFPGPSVPVAFGDGRAERLGVERLRELVQEQTGDTLDELIAEAEGREQRTIPALPGVGRDVE